MNATMTQLSESVDELLAVLQKDIKHIEDSIEKLDMLREFVIKRDDSGLGRLLEEIRSNSQQYIKNQKQRKQLRQLIAGMLGWPIEDVRLGRLQQTVPAEQAALTGQVRGRLQGMISKLQSEHASTVMLLSDLARFNRMLLSTILETGRQFGITYDARGGTSRSGEVSFVNLQF